MIHVKNEHLEAHAYQTAKDSNAFCGDSFYLTLQDDYFLCILADGLGSGKLAYDASQTATSVVRLNPEKSVDLLMKECNQQLCGTRGAAVAILKVDFVHGTFDYSCVGNIRFYVYTPYGKIIYPMPVTGFLSGKPQQFRTHQYQYEANSKFLLHSDGFQNINTRSMLTSNQSIYSLSDQLKAKQKDNRRDDMSFIIGSLL